MVTLPSDYNMKHLLQMFSKNKIIWIVGHRLDNRFKITENTKKIVRIELLNYTI